MTSVGSGATLILGMRTTERLPPNYQRKIVHDVLLVGAGPSGLAAAIHFRRAGLDLLHVEEGAPAQTIRQFPAGVRLFSTCASLALPGYPFGPHPEVSPTREEYIAYLVDTAAAAGLSVATGTTAVSAEAVPGGYRVVLRSSDGTRRTVEARNVVVASGGYFFPNTLSIPGENRSNVHHYFKSDVVTPSERIVVVGGRNSAVEAAVHIADSGAEALLVYRKSRLPRSKIKPWLLPELDRHIRAGKVSVRYRSVPVEITSRGVRLRDTDGDSHMQPADKVFLLTGYGPDYRLLRAADVPFHKRTARPLFAGATLETKSPGIFLCGTVALRVNGEQSTIENSRDHALVMIPSIRTRIDAVNGSPGGRSR